MTISRGTPHHLPSVLALIAAVVSHMQSQGIDQWDDIYPDRATLERDIAEQSLFICTADETAADPEKAAAPKNPAPPNPDPAAPLALIVLNETQSPEYAAVPWLHRAPPGKILVVHRLAVHPAHHRRGLATHLMDFAEAHACRHAYTALRLDTFVANPAANRLYLRRGYRFAGTVTFRKGLFNCYEKPLAAD